jgi:aspartyl-tRNA(Asn)/glutamyl-tRNA(Gln) amidotransferase subunit A
LPERVVIYSITIERDIIKIYIDNYSLMLETIYNNKYSAPKFSSVINVDNKGMCIAIPKEYRMDGISEDFVHHWEKFFQLKEKWS